MLVLVVTKTTNFELYGPAIEQHVARGHLSPDALVRLRQAHIDHYDTLNTLRQELERAHINYDEISRQTDRPPHAAYAAVISVGGDGTLLAASQKMNHGARIYGIRSSVSSVGFLCCAGPSGIAEFVHRMLANTFPTIECSRLRARIFRAASGQSEESVPVLNDFLYANTSPAATTRYRLNYGDLTETHRSSGIWVATAAGSTAAILAAGGERRPLADHAFQFRVRELYRFGHHQANIVGGFFDPEQQPLTIENRSQQALLALDGQHGAINLEYGDRIEFVRAPSIQLGCPDLSSATN